MNLFTRKAGDEFVGEVVSTFFRTGYMAGLHYGNMADLVGTTRTTLYNWRDNPQCRTRIYGSYVLNMMTATKAIKDAVESGDLPARSREHAAKWVRKQWRSIETAPEVPAADK